MLILSIQPSKRTWNMHVNTRNEKYRLSRMLLLKLGQLIRSNLVLHAIARIIQVSKQQSYQTQ